MALTNLQLTAAALDPGFRMRVKASLVNASIAIAVDAPATPLEVRRDRLARDILQNQDSWTERFALAVAMGFPAKSNASLTDATDAEIDTRVAGVFNDFIS